MAAFMVWKFLRIRRRHFKSQKTSLRQSRPYLHLLSSFRFVAIPIIVTFGLAAIQILPSYVWSKNSIRTDYQAPRNIYEAFDPNPEQNRPIVDGLVGTPPPGTHHDHIYQFSQPPWTLAELVWPNASGKAYPTHQRWADGLPGAERMWTPSIYMGCFVFVLGVMALNPFSRNRKFAWLSRVTLFFGIASLGWYGPVWLLNEFAPTLLENQKLGNPTGGFYWLMVVLLPKYVTFRYPAKLVMVALLSLSILAGLKLDQSSRTGKTNAILVGAILVSLGSVAMIIFSEKIASIGAATNSNLFGPFDVASCQSGILFSAIVSIVVVLSCALTMKFSFRYSTVFILLVCCLDLLTQNRWLVPTVTAENFERKTAWSDWATQNTMPTLIHQFGPNQSAEDQFPISWSQTSSQSRLDEIVEWQRDSLQAKHHLELAVQVLDSFYSLEPRQQPHRHYPIWFRASIVSATTLDEVPLTSSERLENLNQLYRIRDIERTWPSCNRFIQEVSQTGTSELRLHLQPVSGWWCYLVNMTDGRVVQQEQPLSPDKMSVTIPAGEPVRIVARYRPTEFIVGAWISGISWFSVLALGLTCSWRRHK